MPKYLVAIHQTERMAADDDSQDRVYHVLTNDREAAVRYAATLWANDVLPRDDDAEYRKTSIDNVVEGYTDALKARNDRDIEWYPMVFADADDGACLRITVMRYDRDIIQGTDIKA